MFTRPPSAETQELLAAEPPEPRTSIHEAQRRPFGAAPAALLGDLGVVALLAAIVLFATGAWIGGIVALAVAIGAIALFVPAVRHDPTSAVSRTARRALTEVRADVRLAAVATRTWARAAVALAWVKQRRYRLRRELRGQLTPLGEAVHRGEAQRAQQLKQRAARLEREMADADRRAAVVVETAREAVEREKETAQPTEALPVDRIRRAG